MAGCDICDSLETVDAGPEPGIAQSVTRNYG